MNSILLAVSLVVTAPDTVVLEERIDLYEPTSGAFLGSERTWFGVHGQRLRLEITDERGDVTLLFFLRHDDQNRESEAIYFESGPDAIRETFSYSRNGRLRTTTYYYEPGVASERTESELDEQGRERRKRYYRADGSQYGEEDVWWNDNGNQTGWDFRFVGREGGATFRYDYQAFDPADRWLRRVRSRNDTLERVEVRTIVTREDGTVFPTGLRFGAGTISTEGSETSPSFTRDGRTMVFARFDDDWDQKRPFIAHLKPDGWQVQPLDIGLVYNLAIAPDGNAIVFSSSDGTRTLFRILPVGDGWSAPENLSARYGFSGTYPCLTEEGDLIFFDAAGSAGPGIYAAPRAGNGFGTATSVFVPSSGEPFDGYAIDLRGSLMVTMCFDSACLSGEKNGVWEIDLQEANPGEARKLVHVPYGWGAQSVPSLGLFLFTDGEDILAIPLTVALQAGN